MKYLVEAVDEKYFSAEPSEGEMRIFQPRLEPCLSSTFSRKKMLDSDSVSAAGDEDPVPFQFIPFPPEMFVFTRDTFRSCTFRRNFCLIVNNFRLSDFAVFAKLFFSLQGLVLRGVTTPMLCDII